MTEAGTSGEGRGNICPRISTMNMVTKIEQKSPIEIARSGSAPVVSQDPAHSLSVCLQTDCAFWIPEHSACSDVVQARALSILAEKAMNS
jgi:hypothetical protein